MDSSGILGQRCLREFCVDQLCTVMHRGAIMGNEETPDTDKGSPSGLPRQPSTLPGTVGGYDYGVFNIANLIANALHGKDINLVTS